MKKAIFYKEWIKTRRYFPIALTVSVIFIIYALLGVQRVINFRGVAHLWEILLSRDVVFIETLTYIPLLAGLLLAIVQFVPEMQQKRLKLTLHLPYPEKNRSRHVRGLRRYCRVGNPPVIVLLRSWL